jgi:integrase
VTQRKRSPEGIRVRHSRSCRVHLDGACNCEPAYEAWVWSPSDRKKIYKTFTGKGAKSAAMNWRADAKKPVREGRMRAPSQVTLREAWEAWLEGAKSGAIRNRSGDTYKPSVIRSYEASMRLHVLDDLGGAKVSAITARDLTRIRDDLLAKKRDPSTIRNAFMPLRALYRHQADEGDLAVNPTRGLRLPAVRGRRERIAGPAEAAALIDALPEEDRALWAIAFYAGLRLGELQALRDEDVDLTAGVIRVERSWDKKTGPVEPKSQAGKRRVPIVSALRPYLAAHRLRSESGGLFLGTGSTPFSYSGVRARSLRVWKKAKLTPIGLHEARHTYASFAIAAGYNAKTLSTYMGHSSITITLDRYGHLMPGNEDESVRLMDNYLSGAQSGGNAAETAQ